MKIEWVDVVLVRPESGDWLWMFVGDTLAFSGHSANECEVATILANARALVRSVKLVEVLDEWCRWNPLDRLEDIPACMIVGERVMVEFDANFKGADVEVVSRQHGGRIENLD